MNSAPQKGTLYIVATPIGNPDDITVRALRILSAVDIIAAEDTRVTRRLLRGHGITGGRLVSYHEHNESERTPGLLRKLQAGASIALVTNAGTPGVSDPGYRLITEAVSNDIQVAPIPGPTAVITGLSAAGLPTDTFVFIGFLPKKKGKRTELLRPLAKEMRTIVFYESPRRISTLLDELITHWGDRYGVLSREMTKRHEEFIRGSLSEIRQNLNHRPSVKGECTLMVSGNRNATVADEHAVSAALIQLIESETHSLSEAVGIVSKRYGVPKKKVYERALQITHRKR